MSALGVGGQFTATVVLRPAEGQKLAAYDGRLSYSSNLRVVSVVGATFGSPIQNSITGAVRFGNFTSPGCAGDCRVLEVTFEAIAAGPADLTLSIESATDDTHRPITFPAPATVRVDVQ